MSDESQQDAEVEVQRGPGGYEERVERHPSYAQVSVSRVSGGTHLYGSDFHHQHFLRVRVSPSALHRTLARDWHFASNKSVVEFDMSESQWARFVSSLGIGSGVPCTLRYVGGEMIPEPPPPTPKGDLFKAEMTDRLDDAVVALRELRERVAAGKGGKDALRLIDRAVQQITNNTGFVAKQFGEHMEEAVDRAREEVHAYAMTTFARLGLDPAGEVPVALPPAATEDDPA